MKGDLIFLLYVDDTILEGPNLDKLIKKRGLRVISKDQTHSFQLRDEVQVGDFLGIRIENLGSSSSISTRQD